MVKSNQYSVQRFDVNEIGDIRTCFATSYLYCIFHNIIQMVIYHLFILLF